MEENSQRKVIKSSEHYLIGIVVVSQFRLRIMYQLTYSICTFMLCISCSQSAPQALLSALLSPSAAVSAPSSPASSRDKHETGLTTYDQKQSGKYNIHLNIKDVAIIALDAGGVDGGVGDFGEDYYEDYDLSDFTVKPIFGLIETDKPSSTTAPPPLIHFEPDEWLATNATSANETENAPSSPIEEPIIKDPVVNDSFNKTQSVVILDENVDASSPTNGIVVTTSTPAPEDLPPKLTLADLANIQSAQKPSVLPALFPTKPNEIPVQIILDSFPLQKQSSRQRPSGNWRLKNRIRAPANHNRRITPPPEESAHYLASASSAGNNKYRKGSLNHAHRRNCVLNANGQCQNSQRRFSSPTL